MTMQGETIAVEVDRVSKFYGAHQVLFDVSLTVGAGEKIVICGPSGSGKSTLIRCLNKLEDHQDGTIRVPPYLTPRALPRSGRSPAPELPSEVAKA